MVAIFSGAGTGFERGSGSVLGSMGLLGGSSLGNGGEQVFYNAFTGNLLVSRNDEFLVGRGPDVAVARTYNSKGDLSDDNGDNWRQSTDRRVYGLTGDPKAVGSTIKRVSGDGSIITYTWDSGDDLYIAKDGGGAYDTISYSLSGNIFTWTDGDTGVSESYEASGTDNWRITKQYDRDGNTVTFTYDANGRLDKVTTADGGYTQYVWDTANGRITEVVTGYTDLTTLLAKTLTRTAYGYDTADRLATVTVDLTPTNTTDSETYTTTYAYTSGRLSSISQTDGSFLDIDYDTSGRVVKFTQTSAGTTTRVTDIWYGTGYTRIEDPNGHYTRLYYDANGALTSIQTDPAATGAPSQTVSFAYNSAGDLTSVTDQAGETVTYADFDDRGHAETETDRLGTLIRRTWGADGELLTDTRIGSDASGSALNHTTRYAYDSENHLRYVLSSEGRVVEYRYNGSGQQVSKIEYSATGPVVTGLSISVSLSEAEFDAWVIAQADKSGAQRTDTFYDHRGNAARAVTYGTLSAFGEGTGGPLAVTPGVNTTVTALADGLYRVEKSAGTNYAYNADAHSATRADGDFVLQLKANQNDQGIVAGLTASPGANAANNSLSFGFHFSGNGALYSREGGTSTSLGQSYTIGMSYWIVRTGTTVKFYEGSTLAAAIAAGSLKTLTNVTGSYYFDSSINALNTSLDVKFTPQPIAASADGAGAPTTTVAETIDGLQRITKTGGTASVWDAAASSSIAATGDFVLRLRPPRKDRAVAAGVSTAPATGLTRDDIRYGLYFNSNGTLYYVHYGDTTSFGFGYNAGDNFWIVRSGTTVSYYKGATLASAVAAGSIRTVTGSTGTLYFDSSLYTSNAAVDVDFAPAQSATVELTRTYFAYDQAGRLLSRFSEGQNPESFVYDGMGRLIASTDLNRGTTTIAFDDTAGQTVVTLANGLTRTSAYNKAGELISVVETGEQVPTATASPFLYDKNGRLRVTTDATGHKTYILYDRAGRKFADVNHYGAIVEYVYDSRDRIVATVRYANKLTSTQLTGLANPDSDVADLVRPTLTDRDVWTWNVHDDEGRVIEAIAGDGAVTTFAYDKSHRLVKTVAYRNRLTETQLDGFRATPPAASVLPTADTANDRITRTFYDDDGNVIGRLDAEGYLHRSSYDWAGRMVSDYTYSDITDSALRATGTFWDLKNSVDDPTDIRLSRYVYDSRGLVRFQLDRLNHVVEHRYDRAGLRTSTVRYAGALDPATTDFSLANVQALIASGNLASDPDTGTSWTVYDAAGRVAFAIDGEDRVAGLTYDNMGQVVATVSYAVERATTSLPTLATMTSWAAGQASNAANRVTRSYYSDRPGEIRFIVDAENYLTEFEYDAAGRQVLETRWEDPVTVTGTTTAADLDALTPGTTAVTKYEYDSAGRLKVRRDAFGTSLEAVTQYGYDGTGDLVCIVDPLGNVTWNYFDAAGRQTVVRDTEGHVTETVYNAFGEVASVTHRFNKATNTAAVGVLPTVTADAARDATTLFSYDQNGRLTKTTDAEGFEESYTLNAFGDRVSLLNKAAGTISHTYDAAGRLLSETLPMSSTNSAGTVVATTVTNKFEYDAFGNTTKKIEAFGLGEERVTIYRYDKAGRLVETEHEAVTILSQADHRSSSSATPRETIVYDMLGNVVQVTDANGASTFSYYDQLGRKIVEIGAIGAYSTFSYDRDGRIVTARTYATAVTVPTAPAATAPAAPAGAFRETVNSYDGLGRLKTVAVTGLRSGEYDDVNDVYVMAAAPGAPVVTATYDYDLNGNVIKATDGEGGILWSYYDKLGRRKAQVDQDNRITTWTFDMEGNALSETRWASKFTGTVTTATVPTVAVHAKDRITNFEYDRNGLRTRETRLNVEHATVNATTGALTYATASSVIDYTYTALGQVDTKTEAAGDIVDYGYDKMGRLTSEVRAGYDESGTSTEVTPTVRYYYDGLGNLTRTRQGELVTATGDRITAYSYGPGGRLASMTDANGQAHVYHYDKAGNLVRDSYDREKADGSEVEDSILYTRDLLGRTTVQRVATWNGSAWTGDSQNLTYNSFGEVSKRGLNGLWQEQLDYDEGGRLWRTNSGDGVWRYNVYDKAGRRTLAIESEGADLSGKTLDQAIALAKGTGATVGEDYVADIVSTISLFDKRGLAIQTILPHRQLSSSSIQTLTSSRLYNAFGEVAQETDAAGKVTDFVYNTMGRILQQQNPGVAFTAENGAIDTDERPIEYRSYDKSGRLVAVKDANGHITSRTLLAGSGYGGTEALASVEFHPDGGKFYHYYDRYGDQTKTTNEIGKSELFYYDKMGRLTEQRHESRPAGTPGNATGAIQQLIDYYAYDLLGQRIRHTNSQLGVNVIEKTDYDAQGRVTKMVDLGGNTTTHSYSWSATLQTAGMGATGAATFGGWTKTSVNAAAKTQTEKLDYFGRTVDRVDHAGFDHAFTFDRAGRLVSDAVVNGGGWTITYGWHNSGQMASQAANGFTATYAYDANGRRTRETYASATVSLKDATATYDAMGRMTQLTDTGANADAPATIDYEYDLAGNVRRMAATYHSLDSQGNIASTAGSQTYWYRYDAMNRFVVTKGALSGARGSGTIGGGATITYDKAGNRLTATKTVSRSKELAKYVPYSGVGAWYYEEPGSIYPDDGNGTWSTVDYIYSADQVETYVYTADGYLAQVSVAYEELAPIGENGTQSPTVGGLGSSVTRAKYSRDAMGRVTDLKEYDAAGTNVVYQRTAVYDAKSQVTSDTVVSIVADTSGGSDTFVTNTTYYYTTTAGAYLAGAVDRSTAVTTKDGAADSTATTTNAYTWRDTPSGTAGPRLEQTTLVTDYESTAPDTTYISYYNYDGLGHLASVNVQDWRQHDVNFVTDMNGLILQRDEVTKDPETGLPIPNSNDPRELHYYFNGIQRGDVSNNGTSDVDYVTGIARHTQVQGDGPFLGGAAGGTSYADFDQSYDPINGLNYESVAGRYSVQQGDTLQSIAAAVWGDGSLWYKIADANGLTGAEALIAGMTLVIPNKVANVHNSAETFRPYDPNDIMGNLSPASRQVISPKPQAQKSNKCGAFGAILLVVIAVAVTAVVAPWASGIIASQAVTGSALAGAVIGGAVAGAAGSIASQAVGLATGIQSKFSWKGVALAALGGAIGGAMGPGGAFGEAGAFGKVGGSFVSGALRGAASSVATQGIAVATGLQDKFDWAGVAAAGLGGGMSSWVDGKLGRFAKQGGAHRYIAQTASSSADAIANATVRSLVHGTDFGDNLIAALPDVIGNTVGNMLADMVSGSSGRDSADNPAAVIAAKIAKAEGIVVGKHIEAANILAKKLAAAARLDIPGESQFGPDFADGGQLFAAGMQLRADSYGWGPAPPPDASLTVMALAGSLGPGQGISRQDAVQLARAMGIDPARPIFIGGGGDGYVSDIVGPWVDQRDAGNFFMHLEDTRIAAAIELAFALGQPVILVGHSWGAYQAIESAYYAMGRGIPVQLLATMDPVVGRTGLLNSVGRGQLDGLKQRLGGTWVNVRATGYETDYGSGDFIAWMGGRMSEAAQRKAHVYIEHPVSHARFGDMMNAANIPGRISEIYEDWPRSGR